MWTYIRGTSSTPNEKVTVHICLCFHLEEELEVLGPWMAAQFILCLLLTVYLLIFVFMDECACTKSFNRQRIVLWASWASSAVLINFTAWLLLRRSCLSGSFVLFFKFRSKKNGIPLLKACQATCSKRHFHWLTPLKILYDWSIYYEWRHVVQFKYHTCENLLYTK